MQLFACAHVCTNYSQALSYSWTRASFKAFHLGNIFVKWFMQLSGDWKHSGVKDQRAAMSFFFHRIAMATLSMRDVLIINISLPLTELEILHYKESSRRHAETFLSGSLGRRYMTWSQPFLYSVAVTLNCPHIWPNSVQTQCVTHGQTSTLDPNPALAQA